MHMPGHKRNTELCEMGNPYAIDITEIEGFDNLHQPEGLLLSLGRRLSRMYGALSSYPLVNGSTAGILAGISATVRRGDKVLIARNCHKAVYHGVILLGLIPVYCYPQIVEGITPFGGILPENIEEALITHPDIKLVIITSPTYEGVVSDIKAIADITHKYGAYLLVDEAHGAHFGFHKGFPQSAVKLGADLVIQSLHKTLPAFTQSAVLHLNAEELIPRIRKYLAVYQSSSPSYLLLSGIDQCIHLLEEKADSLFEVYHSRLEQFYQEMAKLKKLSLLKRDRIGKYGVYELDPSKITISVQGTGLTGHDLHQLLHNKYQIMPEMEAPDYVLGMTSICDTKEGFERLTEALLAIDDSIEDLRVRGYSVPEEVDHREGLKLEDYDTTDRRVVPIMSPPEIKLLPSDAWNMPSIELDLRKSAGQISAAFLSLFPPGAPILIPGEVISEELIEYVLTVKRLGVTVTGLTGETMDRIEVVT
ncbi:MAG: Orn/Lys/Arg decarboxylase major region [Herbinix sp.]|nr:Orn/Lys/Arg decarboxylase major region [Herbinix sp.]